MPAQGRTRVYAHILHAAEVLVFDMTLTTEGIRRDSMTMSWSTNYFIYY